MCNVRFRTPLGRLFGGNVTYICKKNELSLRETKIIKATASRKPDNTTQH